MLPLYTQDHFGIHQDKGTGIGFTQILNLVDVSDIFYFFCSGEEKGESKASGRRRRSVFLLNIRGGGGCRLPGPGGGGWSSRRRGLEGEGPGGCLRGICGGGGG